jgi:NADPH-dependent F420 reductase
MQIALLGGTGDIGEGLALRWAADTDYDVIIGSRDADRAATNAREYETELDKQGIEVDIEGHANPEAAGAADVVVLAVPAYHLVDTIEAVADDLDEDTILVTPAVGMKRDEDGFHYNRPGAGSVTKLAADAAPDGVPVVGAYHNLPAARLANLDHELELDTAIVGDEGDAIETIREITAAIDGLRAIDAGPLANAPEVEAITPLLINVAQYNDDMHDLGVRFE